MSHSNVVRPRAPYNERWKSWPAVRVSIANLPTTSTTLDVYKAFKDHGTIRHIKISETRQGERGTSAEVDFEPPPQHAFWLRLLPFTPQATGHEQLVRAFLTEWQKRKFLINSPTRPEVRYDEVQHLVGTCLDFGILDSPSSMLVMQKCHTINLERPLLSLNLYRKEIEFYFAVFQTSTTTSAARKFRFIIALDDNFKLWRLTDGTLVFHLKKVPWYSKQLAQAMASSHSADGRIWDIEDTWARQTDIVDETQKIHQLITHEIALHKQLNFINIARWTTFRFHIDPNPGQIPRIETFFGALRDWNVKILDGADFGVSAAAADFDKTTWDFVDAANNQSLKSNLADLSSVVLPFSVRYQLEVCMSHGYISEYSLTNDFTSQLAQWPETKARQALIYAATKQERLFDPMVLFSNIEYAKPIRSKKLPDNCIETQSATVTASGVLFHTPNVEITNRVIRKYKSQAHRFLRVRFEDDEYRGQSRLYASNNNKMIQIFIRVRRALTNGIRIGDVVFEFLAWGNSQLRERSAYFVAATASMSADSIRKEMGTFKETVVAKKAARMGQCFSTTRPVPLNLPLIDRSALIPDIKRNGYTFTDGVGKISRLAAELIKDYLKIKGPVPSVFQFRLGGCKGVLAVSNDVPDSVGIQIRESQFKFGSLSRELEIIRCSQFWQPFLNRQIILVLKHLGVPTEVFLNMQEDTVKAVEAAMHNDGAATKALRTNVDPNLMTLNICELVDAGFRSHQEPFVMAILNLWRAWSLKYLKEKAKIPVEQGAFVLGCVDETGQLKGHTSECPMGDVEEIEKDPDYLNKVPEVFCQITDPTDGQRKVIEGVCIVARNPSLHQGDIRVVRAVDNASLRQTMCDVLVLPQTGDRDLASMCSGGDLDGDDYIVIWDERLIPRMWNAEPFHYDPPAPKTSSGEIETSHIINFFIDYVRFDMLGRIAVAHLAAADRLDDGIESAICQRLVDLHSKAVDYPKTGVAAKMSRRLERSEWPHFMEKKRGQQYKSQKVLGLLYDKVKKIKFKPDYGLAFDSRILDNEYKSTKEQLDAVQEIKKEYDEALQRILTQHSIATEFELWSTFVLDHSKKSNDYKFHEEVGDLSRVLKERYHEALCDLAGGKDFEHTAPYAIAAYRVTHWQVEAAKEEKKIRMKSSINKAEIEESEFEIPFISFPWLLQDTLIKIAVHAEESKAQETSAVVQDDQVMEKKGEVELDLDGKASVVYDFSDLNLKTTSITPYLPDPLLSAVQEKHRSDTISEMNAPEDLSKTTAALILEDSSNMDTPVTDVDSSQDESWDQVKTEAEGVVDKLQNNSEIINKPDVEKGPAKDVLAFVPSGNTIHLSSSTSDDEGETTAPIPQLPQTRVRSLAKAKSICPFWKIGHCVHSENDCRYVHYETNSNPTSKEQITCWYWLIHNGRCAMTDQICQFSHRNTGFTIVPAHMKPVKALISTAQAKLIYSKRTRSGRRRSQDRRISGTRTSLIETTDKSGSKPTSSTSRKGKSTDKAGSYLNDLAQLEAVMVSEQSKRANLPHLNKLITNEPVVYNPRSLLDDDVLTVEQTDLSSKSSEIPQPIEPTVSKANEDMVELLGADIHLHPAISSDLIEVDSTHDSKADEQFKDTTKGVNASRQIDLMDAPVEDDMNSSTQSLIAKGDAGRSMVGAESKDIKVSEEVDRETFDDPRHNTGGYEVDELSD